MNRKLHFLHLIFFMFLFVTNYAQVSIWKKNSKQQKKSTLSQPSESIYDLDIESLLGAIKEKDKAIISFPDGKEGFVNFKIQQTHVLPPSLEKKYKSIYSFKGKAVDGSGKNLRFTFSKEFGLKGSINNNIDSRLNIKPINKTEHIFSFDDKNPPNPYACYTDEISVNQFNFKDNSTLLDIDDNKLRRYRIAVSTTGEYSNFFLDGNEVNDNEKITKVLTAVSASIESINELFEVDLGITLQLIENNDKLIFLNGATDPYGSDLNGGLQTELDNNVFIGSDAYDVGHLFHYDGQTYGNAGCIACVCTPGQKGSAFTAHEDPSSEGMNIILAHELGHQFGAYHTQSSTTCASGFNSEVEPGSGSTIMSYAGICSPNVQEEADFYYNYTSIRDIGQWVIMDSNCAEIIDIDNDAPIISAGEDFIIPISTPFVLSATAIDINAEDVLTYCWEQSDADTPFTSDYPSSFQATGPVFRSFMPSLDSKRYFPELTHVVNGTTAQWEVLPEVSRDLNFSLTVRDNAIEGGQTVTDLMKITVNENSGPFRVTSQSNKTLFYNVGETVTINWDVANTNLAPINATTVDILLSIDNGVTFENLIIENTPNDGSESFTLPNVEATDYARFMVKASNNIFYDVNHQNFGIIKSEFILDTESKKIDICETKTAVFNINYITFLGFEETTNISVTNIPEAINYELSQNIFSGNQTDNEGFTLTLSDLENIGAGSYDITVNGTSDEISKDLDLVLNIYSDISDENIALITPTNESLSLPTVVDFEWENNSNASTYTLEISSDETFNTIIETVNTQDTDFTSNELSYNSQYFWRVTGNNECGFSSLNEVSSFSTNCSLPSDIEAIDIGITTAQISWIDTNNTQWIIEYGEKGFVIGEGMTLSSFETSYTLEGLESGTFYDIYLKSTCEIGGFSDYIQPLTIVTSSDFCAGDHFYDTGGINAPYSDEENYTLTIKPDSTEERVRVDFTFFNVENGYDFLSVYNGLSTESTLIGIYSGTNLFEVESTDDSGALTFVFTSDQSVFSDGWDAIVYCEVKPNCLSAQNATINTINLDSAILTWEQEDEQTTWEIEYGEPGFEKGTGTSITTNNTEYFITDLNSNTSYQVYLTTICNTGGFSNTVALTFATEADFCNGDHFYDTGGEFGEYSANEFYTKTIYPDNNTERIRVVFNSFEVETGFDYLEIYDGELINGQLIGRFDSANPPEEIIATHNTGALTFIFSSDNIVNLSGWNATIYCETKPCASPNGFNAQNITTSSVILDWLSTAEESTYIVEYGETGFEIGSGTQINISESEVLLDNLTSNTFYSAYLKTSCDDGNFSDFSDVLNFSTNANYCNGEHFYDTGGEFGEYSNNENYTKTIYPNSDNETIRVFFNSFETESGFDYLTIYDGPDTTSPLIGSYNGTVSPGEIVSSHESGALTFNFSSDSSVTRSGWDATVSCETINCLPVADFLISNITSNSAYAEWIKSDNASEYLLEYGESGFLLGTVNQIITSENYFNIPLLESGINYDVYIKSNCNEDGFSSVIGPITFKTLCEETIVTDNEYIVDGSFECTNTEVWEGLNIENVINDECNIAFTGLENSELLCLDYYDLGNTFYPTDGDYAAYTSLFSFAGEKYSISQIVRLPGNVINATLSFDIKALYYYLDNSSNPNTFTIEFIFNDDTVVDISSINIINDNDIILEQAHEFEYSYIENISNYLIGYEDTDVEIIFSINETENQLIAADLMLDNVSLIINGPTLSTNENEYLKNNISLYPTPNNGTFTIGNGTDATINRVSVYNISGRFIQESTFGIKSSKELYTINNTTPGVYFLKIETDKGKAIFKTIVE